VRRDDVRPAGVVVQDAGSVAETVLDLGTDDRRDLLRRPRRASTACPAGGLDGEVVDLDDHGRF
jgi:hypothetical protein